MKETLQWLVMFSWDFPYLGSFVSLSRALAIVQSCRVVNYLSTLLFAWNKLALVRRAQFQTLCKWDFNSPHKTFPEAQRTLTQKPFFSCSLTWSALLRTFPSCSLFIVNFVYLCISKIVKTMSPLGGPGLQVVQDLLLHLNCQCCLGLGCSCHLAFEFFVLIKNC